VPLALAIGMFPSLIVRWGGLPNVTDAGFIAGLSLIVLLALIPVTLGAAIGVPLGRELERLSLPFPSTRPELQQ